MTKVLKFSNLEDKTIDVLNDGLYELSFNESGVLFFNIKKASKVEIVVNVEDNISARIIFWNEKKDDLNIKEIYNLENGSYLNVIYGELSDGKVVRNMEANLSEGSEVLVDGATISANSSKDQKFIANHNGKYTTSNLNNYGVVSENGFYNLEVVGYIFEDAVGSKAHQDSKILTVSDNQTTKVTPYLYIYENDVEASHAATVGQIDENQLYYMQARGLSEMEAVALVMSGYLMPIANAIVDEKMSDHIKSLISSKVVEICSTTIN